MVKARHKQDKLHTPIFQPLRYTARLGIECSPPRPNLAAACFVSEVSLMASLEFQQQSWILIIEPIWTSSLIIFTIRFFTKEKKCQSSYNISSISFNFPSELNSCAQNFEIYVVLNIVCEMHSWIPPPTFNHGSD